MPAHPSQPHRFWYPAVSSLIATVLERERDRQTTDRQREREREKERELKRQRKCLCRLFVY